MMFSWTWHTAVFVLVTLLCAPLSALPERGLARRQSNSTQSVEVQQLVAGLGFNIMAQNGEIAIASSMQTILSAPTPNSTLFQAAKDDLLGFMSCGMRVRSNNMKLSSINPQITRGLAQLEQTQVLQMAMVNNLTGSTADGPTLAKLQTQVQAAIQKNQILQALATGGSAIPVMMTKNGEPLPAATPRPSI